VAYGSTSTRSSEEASTSGRQFSDARPSASTSGWRDTGIRLADAASTASLPYSGSYASRAAQPLR
jgi:hypothetical protein